MSTSKDNPLGILFVCMGNICRSPLAEGIFRHRLVEQTGRVDIVIDSAGTHSYHVDSPPDQRAQKAAARRGVDISQLGARKFSQQDFDQFDYILVMDFDNRDALLELAQPEHESKVQLLLEYADVHRGHEVPDPYYGGPAGFERVIELIEEATIGLLNEVSGR